MKEQRYIRWKVTPLEGGLYALQITEQSHKGFRSWKSSNGITVDSKSGPAYHDDTATLLVRGELTEFDLWAVQLTADQLEKCERALTEYNFAHSEYAQEWEIVGWKIIEGGDWCVPQGGGGPIVACPGKDTRLVVRRKKSDEDKAREAFLASDFFKEWEIVDYRKPIDGESGLRCDHKTIAQHGNPNPELDVTRRIIIRRKQPQVPTGEAYVGCLCWCWDSETTINRRIAAVTSYEMVQDTYMYIDHQKKQWLNAVPLTPEEVEEYLANNKKAWSK